MPTKDQRSRFNIKSYAMLVILYFINNVQSLALNISDVPNAVKNICLYEKYSLSQGNFKKKAQNIVIAINGQCYNSIGSGKLIPGGTVEFVARHVDDSTFSPYWQELKTLFTEQDINISATGEITTYLSIDKKGPHYILVVPHGYGIQWWDGGSIFEQPQPVDIAADTIYQDFHFQPRCSLSCTIAPPKSVSSAGLTDQYGCYIFPPSSEQGRYRTIDNIAVTNIPPGKYYLTVFGDHFINKVYPEARNKKEAQVIEFDSPGQIIDTLSWSLSDSEYVVSQPAEGLLDVDYANLDFEFIENPTQFLWRIDDGRIGFSGISKENMRDTFRLDEGDKYFLGVSHSSRIIWYPGTLLRSEAETLFVQGGETRSIAFTADPIVGQIRGNLPVYSDKDVSYFAVLSPRGEIKSNGSSCIADSTGRMAIYTAPGYYSLWNIPLTVGSKYVEGWTAFGVDSIQTKTYGASAHYFENPRVSGFSLHGTLSCRNTFYVAAFDTNGRVASASWINIRDYYRNMTGPRGRFFSFELIEGKPYNIEYYLNFLQPGKYALAKIENKEYNPGFVSLEWYGSPANDSIRFIEVDDVTLLDIPEGVAWVQVDSSKTISEVPAWTNTKIVRNAKPAFNKNRISVKCINRNVLQLINVSPDVQCRIRVFGINGQQYAEVKKIFTKQIAEVQLQLPNQIVLVEVVNGTKRTKRMVANFK